MFRVLRYKNVLKENFIFSENRGYVNLRHNFLKIETFFFKMDFLLMLAFVLGILSSVSDIRFGKIRNWYIYPIFFIAVIIQFVFFFSWQYMANLGASIFFGYLLWDFGIWTAGDGKLFSVYSAVLPLYIYGNVGLFPSLFLLVMAVVPIFLFWSVFLIFKIKLRQLFLTSRRIFAPSSLFKLLFSVIVFSLVSRMIFSFFDFEIGYFGRLFLLLFFVSLFEKLPRKIYVASVGCILFLSLFFLDGFIFYDVSLFFMVFLIFRVFILEVGFDSLTYSVSPKDLKVGMVLADVYYREKNKVRVRKGLFFSFFSYIRDKKNPRLLDSKAEGLSKADIKKIRALPNSSNANVRIHKTMPFAPFLFAGVFFLYFIAVF